MLTAFSLFFSQIVFKTFSIGIIANILFALSFLFTLGIKAIKKSSLEEVKNYFYVMVYIFLYYFILDYLYLILKENFLCGMNFLIGV